MESKLNPFSVARRKWFSPPVCWLWSAGMFCTPHVKAVLCCEERILDLCEHRGKNLQVTIRGTWVPSFASDPVSPRCLVTNTQILRGGESVCPPPDTTTALLLLVHPFARRQQTQCGLLHLRKLCCKLGAPHFCPLPSPASPFVAQATACCFAPRMRGKMPIVSRYPEEKLMCPSQVRSCEFQLHTDC